MAAFYVAGHGEDLEGVILLAAYPTKDLPDKLSLLTVCGSEDGVLNWKKLEEGAQFAPENYRLAIIEGGNHAQFGSYGVQQGDGSATISGEEQVEITVNLIISFLQEANQ